MNNLLQEYIAKYKSRIDKEIEQEFERRLKDVNAISSELSKIIVAMQELSRGGKRLRGILTILGYELAGKKVDDEIIKVTSMMEIFHLGLLIQDDFMDNDTLRRGVKTMLSRYEDRHTANFVSMLAGDYTFGWGIEILSSLKLEPQQVINAFQVWGNYFTRVGYGQTLDGFGVADNTTIQQILELKSGEYSCVLPIQLGATLGGAEEKLMKFLYEYAMEMGYVFQLRDDFLGEYGDSAKTGKPVGNDSREGKHTYATMNGKEKTLQEIEKHMKLSQEILNGYDELPGDSRDVLSEIVTWLGSREN